MIMCVLLRYPVSIRTYYQQGVLFLVIHLLLVLEVWDGKPTYRKSVLFRVDLGPLLQGQMSTAKLKSAYNSLIIGPRQTKTKYTCYCNTSYNHMEIVFHLCF